MAKMIVIQTSDEIHKEIKMRATFRGQTMKEWILQAIVKRIEEEQKYERTITDYDYS